jgi:hypothetical protein
MSPTSLIFITVSPCLLPGFTYISLYPVQRQISPSYYGQNSGCMIPFHCIWSLHVLHGNIIYLMYQSKFIQTTDIFNMFNILPSIRIHWTPYTMYTLFREVCVGYGYKTWMQTRPRWVPGQFAFTRQIEPAWSRLNVPTPARDYTTWNVPQPRPVEEGLDQFNRIYLN